MILQFFNCLPFSESMLYVPRGEVVLQAGQTEHSRTKRSGANMGDVSGDVRGSTMRVAQIDAAQLRTSAVQS